MFNHTNICYRHAARSRAGHVDSFHVGRSFYFAPRGFSCFGWGDSDTFCYRHYAPLGLDMALLMELGILFLLENYAPVGAAIDLNYQGIVEADVADQAIIVERLFHR